MSFRGSLSRAKGHEIRGGGVQIDLSGGQADCVGFAAPDEGPQGVWVWQSELSQKRAPRSADTWGMVCLRVKVDVGAEFEREVGLDRKTQMETKGGWRFKRGKVCWGGGQGGGA